MRTVVHMPSLRVVVRELPNGHWWGVFERDADCFGATFWRRLSEVYPDQKPMHLEAVVIALALALERSEKRYRDFVADWDARNLHAPTETHWATADEIRANQARAMMNVYANRPSEESA